MILTLEEMKAHLNLSDDLGNADDGLITAKIAAAQNHIERLLGYRIEATFGGVDQDAIPPALVEAVSQLAGHWYENREAVLVGVQAQALPFSVWDIVNEYREYSFDG